jgi:hypothetical protein
MSTRDPWDAFAAEFADVLTAQARWTPEQMDAAAEEYAREQMATAQSEQAQADNIRSYNK